MDTYPILAAFSTAFSMLFRLYKNPYRAFITIPSHFVGAFGFECDSGRPEVTGVTPDARREQPKSGGGICLCVFGYGASSMMGNLRDVALSLGVHTWYFTRDRQQKNLNS